MSKFVIFLGLVAAISIALPAQAGISVKNGVGGVGPPQWHFAFHFDEEIVVQPSFVIGITVQGLSGVGLPKHMKSASATPGLVSMSWNPGRPGPNTITWHWAGPTAIWPSSLWITSFIQSAPGDVSVPMGGAWWRQGTGTPVPITIMPNTFVGMIPEPTALGLMGVALIGAVFARPRRKR